MGWGVVGTEETIGRHAERDVGGGSPPRKSGGLWGRRKTPDLRLFVLPRHHGPGLADPYAPSLAPPMKWYTPPCGVVGLGLIILMEIHEYPWRSIDIRGYPRISIATHRYLWMSREFIDIHGHPWLCLDNGYP